MPLPNEHSARLKEPREFSKDTFRRTKGGTIYVKVKVPVTISIIWGKLKGKNLSIPQALRFPTKDWTAAKAKQWLKDNKVKYISFEAAAKKEKNMMNTISALVENTVTLFNRQSLHDWYVENSDAEGIIGKEIVLFEDAYCENATGGRDFVMSDFKLNRLGMKIDPEGWILKNYRKNPVLLWSHDHGLPSIGKMKNVRVEDKALRGKAEFDADDPFAVSISRKIDSGYLNAGSVGFKILRIEIIEPKSKEGEVEVISREQELYEFSIVNIPASVSSKVTKNEGPQDDNEDYMEKLFVDNEEHLTVFKDRDKSGVSFFSNNKENYNG